MGTRKSKKRNLKVKRQEAQRLEDINSMNAIETIEQIVQLAEDCKLSESFFMKVNPYLHHLAVKQGIKDIQALFLALFVERSYAPFHRSV